MSTAPKLSLNQWMALWAASNYADTGWVRANTIRSLVRLGLIRWMDRTDAERGSYITTPLGDEVCEELGSPY